ncbi:MAG: hypothetical protein RKO25_11715 [Candidatus Contendobacter sp.]|nr:hypothetical protein [Candidatus Contendobacter sp.]
MMTVALPAWVEAAMVVMDATSCRERLKNSWHDIKLDVLPGLNALSDVGKQLVFEQALWVPIYFNEHACGEMRKACSEIQDLNQSIVECTTKLIDLLSRLDELTEEFGLPPDVPNIWRTLEKAAAHYPTWHSVSKAHGGMNDFLRVATGQSLIGPGWIDLLDEFINASGDVIESEQMEIISSRKRTADFSRAMLQQLGYLNYVKEHIPTNFKLTDQAIATLVNVLGELDPLATSDGIKMLRSRIKKKYNG